MLLKWAISKERRHKMKIKDLKKNKEKELKNI